MGRTTMLRWLGIAAWIAAAIAAQPALAQAPDLQAPGYGDDAPARVGRIADVGGEVYHAPEDRASDWSTIGINYPIASGDNLWVAEGGRAEIDVGVAQLRLGGETNVHVARLDDRAIAFFVAQGSAILRLRVLEPGEVARIDTPNTQVVLTRPGLYRVDVTADRQRTTLVVREGEATMPTQGGMQQVLPGQTAQADGLDATYVDVRHGIATDGFDSWSANRDRRYQRRVATQYVSPQMVGYAELDDYGRWENDPTYGAVWYPTLGADADWAPYRNGYWTSVPVYGWTWVDSAPWGYAPSHYGRWVYNGGRWGWCPGAYIARPYWAPAMVGWVGGAGWATLGIGGPVYAWAPLAWGEPFRPWWGNCSYRCWTHYNRPYAVRTDERNWRAPPSQYVNARRPGGVTAVGSATFTGQRPVRANLVNVPASQAVPVAMSAPSARPTATTKPLVKPGMANTPAPASTYYSGARRDAIGRPATPGASGSGASTVTSVPGASKPGSAGATTSAPVPRATAPARNYPTSPPASYAQPSAKPSPPMSAPSSSVPMNVPPPTRYVAPVQRETVQPYNPPPQRMAPQPQPAYTAPVQRGTAQPYNPPPQRMAPQPQPLQSAPSAGAPMPPARMAPPPPPQVQQVAPPPPPAAAPSAPSAPAPQAPGRGHNNNDGGGRGGNDGGGADRGAGAKPGQK